MHMNECIGTHLYMQKINFHIMCIVYCIPVDRAGNATCVHFPFKVWMWMGQCVAVDVQWMNEVVG